MRDPKLVTMQLLFPSINVADWSTDALIIRRMLALLKIQFLEEKDYYLLFPDCIAEIFINNLTSHARHSGFFYLSNFQHKHEHALNLVQLQLTRNLIGM